VPAGREVAGCGSGDELATLVAPPELCGAALGTGVDVLELDHAQLERVEVALAARAVGSGALLVGLEIVGRGAVAALAADVVPYLAALFAADHAAVAVHAQLTALRHLAGGEPVSPSYLEVLCAAVMEGAGSPRSSGSTVATCAAAGAASSRRVIAPMLSAAASSSSPLPMLTRSPLTCATICCAAGTAAAAAALLGQEVVANLALRPGDELDGIIRKAMARDPDDRQQGIVELRQELVAFMRGGSLPRRELDAGHEIVREGDVGEHAYIIVSGACEVTKTIEGKRQRLRTIGPGECFGETAIMTSEPRTASVVIC